MLFWWCALSFHSIPSPAKPPLRRLSSLPATSSISQVLFPATSPPMTSSCLISILPDLTSIDYSVSYCSFGLACSLVLEWHPFPLQFSLCNLWSVPVVQVLGRCLPSQGEVAPCHPFYNVGACCPGMRSLPVIRAARLVPASRCSCQYEVRDFPPICQVGACCPSEVDAFCLVIGRCLTSGIR